MEPLFSNDAIVLGILIIVLAIIFHTSSIKEGAWKKFYTYVPALLLCYFIPAILHYPLGLIAPEWYNPDLLDFLKDRNVNMPSGMSFNEINEYLDEAGLAVETKQFIGKSKLYFVASRYLLPASLVLLCLSIDFKGILNLGPKAIIMFLTATAGIIVGGPIALLVVTNLFPNLIEASPDDVWRGLSTVAGSWIGGGANQTAMKEIYEVKDNLFASMIVVDVIVANIWMGFLLYGASITEKIDGFLKSDTSAIEALKEKVKSYREGIERIPTMTDAFVMLAVAFGATAFAHYGADVMVPFMTSFSETLESLRLNSLMSHFFWLIVICTTVGLLLSFTSFRKLEGVGASRWGSVFIYILVATIGMKMNVGEIYKNLGLFAVGGVWMLIHVIILLVVAYFIKAPFFFVAVGSQANVGGAASAPIVASAFSPALAPVGVLLAVLGYAAGTYGAIICAMMMQGVAN